MKMKKRIAALLLAVVLVVSLTGCKDTLTGVAHKLMGTSEVSERYYMAQNIPVNKIDGYVEHTATLWREFTMKGCHLRLQAEVINLTDKQYDVIKYYPMPGRSWRITSAMPAQAPKLPSIWNGACESKRL